MEKGFFGSLFDLSFTSFVTPKLVKILFIISLVLLGIAYIFIAISIFSSGGETTFNATTGEFEESGGNAALGILWLLVLGPLFLFFYTLLYRVFFEIVIVFFRIYENTRDQVSLLRGDNPETAAPQSPGDAPTQTLPPEPAP